jgi:hypothetical protein
MNRASTVQRHNNASPTLQCTTPGGPIRTTPYRHAQRSITRYRNFERIDEPIRNRNAVPGLTPSRLRVVENAPIPPPSLPPASNNDDIYEDDEDAVMAEGLDPETGNPVSPSAAKTGRMRNALATTVTLRKAQEGSSKIKDPPPERTWARHFFDITHLQSAWVKRSVKGHPTLRNRLWTCQYL